MNRGDERPRDPRGVRGSGNRRYLRANGRAYDTLQALAGGPAAALIAYRPDAIMPPAPKWRNRRALLPAIARLGERGGAVVVVFGSLREKCLIDHCIRDG